MAQDRSEISGWMDRAAGGDDDAFAALAGSMQDGLYRFALAQGLRSADAAEATQEVLLRSYRHRRRWRRGGDAVAWLFGIAMNVVREFRRRRPPAVGGLDLDLLGGAADEGDRAAAAEALSALAAALARLPPRQREAVTCRYLRQMSVAQTAAAMGCAEGTVKATVFAALRALRKMMPRNDDRRGEHSGRREDAHG